MVKFFIRFSVIVIMITLVAGIVAGFDASPLLAAIVFVNAWLVSVSFRNIFWWIFTFAVLFGLLHYDTFGLYIIAIVVVVVLFDFVYAYLQRTANNSFIILYLTAFACGVLVTSVIEVVVYRNISIDVQWGLVNIISTLGIFIFSRFLIKRAERFINLYTHGIDMRCHT